MMHNALVENLRYNANHVQQFGSAAWKAGTETILFDAANVIEELSKRITVYENAEAQRRLIVLPETLYEADPTPVVRGVIEWTVTGVCYYDGAVLSYMVRTKTTIALISGSEIGKTVFLTPEEAEAALSTFPL